jgi:acyl carrier protein
LDTYATLASIMKEVFADDRLSPTPDMTAEDVDGWDSLSNLWLVLAIERTFAVKFTTAEVAGLENVGQLVGLIEAKRSSMPAAAGP